MSKKGRRVAYILITINLLLFSFVVAFMNNVSLSILSILFSFLSGIIFMIVVEEESKIK